MKKKNLKYLFCLIPLLLGLFIGICGIVQFVHGQNMHVPDMADDGWFDAQTRQNTAKFLGSALMMFGFVFVGLGSTLFVFSAVRKQILAEQNANLIFNDKIKKLNAENVCPYCGGVLPNNVVKCDSCGAKVKRDLNL